MTQLPFRLQPILNQAQQLYRAGDYAGALQLFAQIADAEPKSGTAFWGIGASFRAMGHYGEAHKAIQKALKLEPQNAVYHHDMALVYKGENRFDKAFAELDTAIKLKPGEPMFRAAKAELLYMQADNERAMRAIEPLLTTGVYINSVAIIFAKISQHVGRQAEAIEHLQHCLAKFDLIPIVKAKLLFGMADVLNSLGRHDEAMGYYHQANAVKFTGFDATSNAAVTDRVIRNWTREAIAKLPTTQSTDDRPVLIVGMPRSGTSLVEQILASHPQVFGGGELGELVAVARAMPGERINGLPYITDPAAVKTNVLREQAAAYSKLLTGMDRKAKRITDKNPLNFINLGLLQMMLPKARVIHCVRDPIDTCLSCYFQLFNGNLQFAYDLSAAGAFYCDYQRLMAHWKQALDLPILDVVYEDLVANQEAVSRRIIEFAGLEWDARCLAFHESERVTLTASTNQVRQPMYTSATKRHSKYESHLEPLLAALRKGGAISAA